ncbi:hypothetical protein G3480_06150 [Thiorhodococcus mannitoliphagus]|uniref:Uncharacterized protein n=1 Tax=Thiorhodococcus mannitoliphagus TaxID=329406 RepID=A0A6P1DQU0_9GAMM|nr:hypothetical protein [Thiorhodococcus mannitoliphagus]NEX19900.1 hypothetical protein [Thiorhodococcus mannitoliphagus]
MWQDPIVTETRQLREQYAGTLAHDIDAIFEDIRSRQGQAGKRLVSFPARPVRALQQADKTGSAGQ